MSSALPTGAVNGAQINARMDRLPGWNLRKATVLILGFAYFIDVLS